MNTPKVNFNIVFTVLFSYILIRFIDNYESILGIFRVLLSLLTPFVIAFILAYVLSPVINLLEKKLSIKRGFSLLITYGVIILLLVASLVFTAPTLFTSLVDLVNDIPVFAAKTQTFILNLAKHLENVDRATLQDLWNQIVAVMPDIGNLLIGSMGEIFATTFSVSKFIVHCVLAFIICFYLLLQKESFISFSKKVVYVSLGKRVGNLVLDVGKTLNINIGKYFSGKIFDSFIVGVISAIGLYFIKSEYALLFGTLIGFMNMIPYFGPVIGMTPVVIVNLFSDPTVALMSLIWLLIVQQIEVAFIEPKIVGGQLGLSPFLTILAVTVGGGFFGLPGMILSVPIMGVIKTYFSEFIDYKYKKIED